MPTRWKTKNRGNFTGDQGGYPSKSQQEGAKQCDWWHYKERHLVECMFGKLKYYRRLAMRYEKKALHFMGMLALAGVFLWLQ